MRIKLFSRPVYTGSKVLDGDPYILRIKWNTYSEKWHLHLKGVSNGVEIYGIALLCGKDLLAPYGYRHLLGELWLIDNSGRDEDPGFYEMGTRWTLEYTPKAS
jgi:hypothetical protein